MGKKGSNKKTPYLTVGSHASITLREESSGKRQTNVSAKSLLKLDHIRNLAVWAGGEASILPLGAFFGHQLAALGEALGSQPDPSLFPCEKCESILQPGLNCTVRIEKNTAKARHRGKKPNNSPQNYVVYTCHFCSHRNLKRGTPRAHMKTLCPPKPKSCLKKPEPSSSTVLKYAKLTEPSVWNAEVKLADEIASPGMTTNGSLADGSSTPLVRRGMTLLEAKSRKRNRSGCKKKVIQCESDSAKTDAEKSVNTLNRRKRKSWTSLKEIAESNENSSSRMLANLAIPYII